MRRRKGTPWFQDVLRRARFEERAGTSYVVRSRCSGRSTSDLVTYQVVVPVPEYQARKVTITFYNTFTPILKSVIADGPTESLHRYGSGRLCMWHPDDPSEKRWVQQDGLLQLIVHTRVHLFKEAWWRETGEWLGDQAPHGIGKEVA
jgi:hypothetical protein